jgi:acetyl-CoA acetyltransferase
MTDAVIASAARTPIGSYGKSLKDVPPSEFGRLAAVAAIERAGIEPSQVDHVVFGNVIHTEPGDALGVTAKILDEMERSDLSLGLVTLCIGGGQGIALLLGRK